MEEIIEYEEKLLQAFRQSDIEVLENLIHDDLIFNSPLGQIVDKEMDISTFKSEKTFIDTMDCIEREIRLFDDVALVSTVIYLKGSFMDFRVDGKARFFRTWKKFGDGWKVIGGASVTV